MLKSTQIVCLDDLRLRPTQISSKLRTGFRQPHSKRRSSAARGLAGATDANIPSTASSPQHVDPLIQAPIWTYTTAAPKLQTHIRKWGGFYPSALTPDAGDGEGATNGKGRVPRTGNDSPGLHETERRVFDSPPASHVFC